LKTPLCLTLQTKSAISNPQSNHPAARHLSADRQVDRMEGFRSGRPSLYSRVLVPVLTDSSGELAWVYAGEQALRIENRLLASGCWSE